jgi:hypothetical protein
MPRYAPHDDGDEDGNYEADLDRQRTMAIAWIMAGIPMNKKQAQWVEGRRAEETIAASQRKAMQSLGPAPAPGLRGDLPPTYTASTTRNEKTPAKRAIQMYSESRKNWCPVEATFDTGTTENWISADTVARLKYDVEDVPAAMYYTFTGEALESSKVIRQVRWCINTGTGAGARSRWADFRIAPKGAPFVVLFGRDLIFSEDIFSFNEAALILTKVDEAAAEKKAKEKNKERVEAEVRALAEERQSATTNQKPKGWRSSGHKKKNKWAVDR